MISDEVKAKIKLMMHELDTLMVDLKSFPERPTAQQRVGSVKSKLEAIKRALTGGDDEYRLHSSRIVQLIRLSLIHI